MAAITLPAGEVGKNLRKACGEAEVKGYPVTSYGRTNSGTGVKEQFQDFVANQDVNYHQWILL